MNNTFALDCDFVAKIHPFNDINQVEIVRAGNKPEKASFFNRRLCPSDVVKVPKSISQIHIKYQSNKWETVEAGSSYEVVALVKPCQGWCKFKAKIFSLFGDFTETEPDKENYGIVGDRGIDKSSPIIKMPLAASEGSDYEFFLSADNTAIPLFWYGGKAPYKLTVKDASSKIIVEKQLEKPEFTLTLPDTKIGSKYKLTIQSANSSDCNENSWICQKPLVVTALPNVIDSMENLVPLLKDCDRNWRLEIWRQLSVMPDSEAKQNLMEDLAENDFELCE
jgi:hypothetical protein